MLPVRTSRSIESKHSIGSPERCYNNSIERLYKINLNEIINNKGEKSGSVNSKTSE